jgi:dihydropteroate synthase
MRPAYAWRLPTRTLELGKRTLLMGVINVTPDSFSDGGLYIHADEAIAHALRLVEDGADILDIGGESTRPGVTVAREETAAPPAVSKEEELQRILPVIQAVRRERPEAIISVETYKAAVARSAVASGADIINDVSALQWDSEMAMTCAELHCGVVLMHTRGRPTDWRDLESANNIVGDVGHDLANRVQVAFEAGVEPQRIVLDPGFGFGKNFEENLELLAGFAHLQRLGFPLLAGVSRKGFIGKLMSQRTGRQPPASKRLNGSIAAMVACILQGSHIVRVHDVKASVEAAAVADAILAAS